MGSGQSSQATETSREITTDDEYNHTDRNVIGNTSTSRRDDNTLGQDNNNTPSGLTNDIEGYTENAGVFSSPKKKQLPPLLLQSPAHHRLEHGMDIGLKKQHTVANTDNLHFKNGLEMRNNNLNDVHSDLDMLERELAIDDEDFIINSSEYTGRSNISKRDPPPAPRPRHTSTPEWGDTDWENEEDRILTEFDQTGGDKIVDPAGRDSWDSESDCRPMVSPGRETRDSMGPSYPETYAQKMTRQQYTNDTSENFHRNDNQPKSRNSTEWNIEPVPNIDGFDPNRFKAFNVTQETDSDEMNTASPSQDSVDPKNRILYDDDEEDLIANIENEYL